MKLFRKVRKACVFACLMVLLAGCGSAAQTDAEESLDIDYVGEDGAVTEETVTADKEGVIDRLTDKLGADKENAGNQTELPADTQDSGEESGLQAAYSEGNRARSEEPAGQDGAGGNGQSSENPGTSASGTEKDSEEAASVTITIRCDTAVANGMHEESKWSGIVPADGCILPVTTMEIEEGDTVFDLLCRVRDNYKLQMEYSGSGGSEYIKGINNLYEFDGGRWSGWMYCVNDWYPNYGCGQYVVSDGDEIEWNYTCDLGADLDGAEWEGAEDWKNTHE